MKKKNIVKLTFGLLSSTILTTAITLSSVSCSSVNQIQPHSQSVADSSILQTFAADFDKAKLWKINSSLYKSEFKNYFYDLLNDSYEDINNTNFEDAFSLIKNHNNNFYTPALLFFQENILKAIQSKLNYFKNINSKLLNINNLKILAIIPSLTKLAQTKLDNFLLKFADSSSKILESNTFLTKEESLNSFINLLKDTQINLDFNIQIIGTFADQEISKTVNTVPFTIPSLFSIELTGFNFSNYYLKTKDNSISKTLNSLDYKWFTKNSSINTVHITNSQFNLLKKILSFKSLILLKNILNINFNPIVSTFKQYQSELINNPQVKLFNQIFNVLSEYNLIKYPLLNPDNLKFEKDYWTENGWIQIISKQFINNFLETTHKNEKLLRSISTNWYQIINNLRIWYVFGTSNISSTLHPTNGEHFLITMKGLPLEKYTINGINFIIPSVIRQISHFQEVNSVNQEINLTNIHNLNTLFPLTDSFHQSVEAFYHTLLKIQTILNKAKEYLPEEPNE